MNSKCARVSSLACLASFAEIGPTVHIKNEVRFLIHADINCWIFFILVSSRILLKRIFSSSCGLKRHTKVSYPYVHEYSICIVWCQRRQCKINDK